MLHSIFDQREPKVHYRTLFLRDCLSENLKRASYFLERLRSMRQKFEYVEIEYRSLMDLIESSYIKKLIGLEHIENITKLLTCHGAIANDWHEIKEQVEKELISIFYKCRSKTSGSYRERGENEDTSIKIAEANLNSEAFQSKKSEILEKLAKFFPNENTKDQDPEDSFHMKRVQILLTYSIVKEHLKDISGIHLLNGQSLVEINMQDMDLIEILPAFDSNDEVGNVNS